MRLRRRDSRLGLSFERLEDRAVPALMHPTFVHQDPHSGLHPFATSSPTGEAPATIRHAYGADAVTFGSLTGDGSGQTIAIVDAFDLPTAASDLAAFDAFYGLAAPPTFKKVNQTGGTSLPAADARGGWGVEIALDIEWAHAVAPKANILLVEANSASDTNLYTVVDTARNSAGVTAVSMSWGGDESSADSANDDHFTTPSGHGSVTFLASSGDNGAYSDTGSTIKIVGYPAVSPNVVGVGGTFLTTGTGGSYVSESGWSNGTSSNTQGGSGGGISKYFGQPSYQAGVVTQSSTFRTVPDVAFDADPNSGASIYDTYDNGSSTPWDQVGGTSLAAPMWAGVIAVANQGRALNGLGSLDGRADTLPKLYALPSTDFHDVTTGNNGYAAGAGYDLVTGRGSPVVNKLVADLAGGSTSGTPVIGSLAVSPPSVTAGTPVTLTAANVTETGGTVSTVTFYRETNGTSGLQVGSDTLVGTGTQSGTTWTLSNVSTTGFANGTYTFYAVATDTAGTTSTVASATLTVTNPATGGTILAWDVAGLTNFGPQGYGAGTVASGVTNSTGLTRGPGVSTTSTAASNAWGGNGWASTSAAGISGGQYVTFGMTVAAGHTLSLSSIDLYYRHSGTGPPNGLWQYQLNGGTWVTIADITNEFPSTSSSGAAMAELNLSGVGGLQNVAAGTTVTIRLVPYGATSSGGTWYIFDTTGNDLVVNGSV
jgi:subtilase family serine protease